MTERDEDDNFLNRWSRRKRDVEESEAKIAEETPPLANIDAVNLDIAAGGDLDVVNEGVEEDREPTAEELEMAANREIAEAVDLETLDYESDYKLFMKNGVPEALKKRAMQKLWRSNPLLANVDGLNDYDEDFNDPINEGYKSIYKVGQGFLTDEDVEQQAERTRLATALDELGDDEAKIETSSSSVRAPGEGEEVAEAALTPDEVEEVSEIASEEDTAEGAADEVAETIAESQTDDEVASEVENEPEADMAATTDEEAETGPAQARVSIRSRLSA